MPLSRRQFAGFAAVLGIVLATCGPAPSFAQNLPRVIIVSNGDENGFRSYGDSFLKGMRALGHAEDRTFRYTVLYANLEPTRAANLILQAVAQKPDVLLVSGLTNARRAREASDAVPIVVATSSDLVDAGVIASFGRPGANLTGITDLADEATAKRLEILGEMMPRLARVALLNNPDFPSTPKIEQRVAAAARARGVQVLPIYAQDRDALVRVLDGLEKLRVDALLLGGDALFVVNARAVIERARAAGVPVVHYWPGTAEMGALVSHHADIYGNYERAAYYVDRILKGTKAADLPVEQPSRYELVVNRKVAASFGLKIPRSILLRADRVID